MEYNAIIRKYAGKSLKVTGRLHITDLKDVPNDWEIKYCSVPLDRYNVNIEDLCCGPTNPLQIYPAVDKAFPVFIRDINGRSVEVMISEADTVKALKWKLSQQTESSLHPFYQKLYVSRNHHEKKLKESNTLAHYGISDGATIFLKTTPELLHGVKYTAIDLDATYPRISTQEDSPAWARYSPGINLCGGCPNQNCISRKLGLDVVVKMGYGETRISLITSNFTCPACDDSIIFPDKFLVACARSLIRYKRAGEELVVTSKLVQSLEPAYQFQEIYLGYPYLIEINTVEPWRSPYVCVRCDTSILFKSQEFKMGCGHIYHKLCKPENLWSKCRVCPE